MPLNPVILVFMFNRVILIISTCLKSDFHESVHRDKIMKVTNKMQLYRLIYYS